MPAGGVPPGAGLHGQRGGQTRIGATPSDAAGTGAAVGQPRCRRRRAGDVTPLPGR